MTLLWLLIGRDLRQDPHLKAIVGEPLAIYEEPGAPDETRLVVSTAVAGSTMRVSLAQSLDLVYGHWRRKAWTIGLTSALLISGIITLISLLHRESRQRSRVQVALAEANARLERMATTDPLTGIANRRMFDDMLRREQARVTRMPHDAAILMIDIDLFKSFNDTYGHGAGDATLRSVALAITRTVARGGDLAARIGGEEFAVLLTETDLSGARAVADRIRETVAALGIRHSGSPHGHVTVSIGLASTGVGPFPASFDLSWTAPMRRYTRPRKMAATGWRSPRFRWLRPELAPVAQKMDARLAIVTHVQCIKSRRWRKGIVGPNLHTDQGTRRDPAGTGQPGQGRRRQVLTIGRVQEYQPGRKGSRRRLGRVTQDEAALRPLPQHLRVAARNVQR